MVRERGRLTGELAHASVPDLKESVGGLRDATDAQGAGGQLAGRRTPRRPGALPDGAARRARRAAGGRRAGDRPGGAGVLGGHRRVLGLPDGTAAQRHTRGLARRITHLSRLAWRRAEAVLRQPSPTGAARPRLETIAPGVAIAYEEVVLDRGAHAGRATRCCCCAPPPRRPSATWCSRRTTAARLVREGAPLPDPWPAGARDLFVRLLAAGAGPARRVGDPRRDRRAGARCCPSGSGCGCCRTPRWCTGSPSTGTSSRPASRPRR